MRRSNSDDADNDNNSGSGSGKKNPRIKPRTLSENWKAMAYNDRRNLSRKLNVGDSDDSGSSSGIHFVNIQMGGDDNSVDSNNDDDESTVVTNTTYVVDDDDEHDESSNSNMTPIFQRNEIVETVSGKSIAIPSSQFSIPTLPHGKTLRINILST